MLSLISIHIPKTAGTNFIETLKLIYGDRIHMDYGTERDLTTARTCAREILSDPEMFRTRCDVIHGHFHYLKYAHVFADVPILATLRHPVARIVSQYRHIALHGDRNVEIHRAIMNGEMDVEKFARRPAIGNAQSIFLEGVGVDRLTHAIIQEHFAQTVERFCMAIGFDPKHPRVQELIATPINSRVNEKWDSKAIPVDPAAFPQLEKFCIDDLSIYNRALERFVV